MASIRNLGTCPCVTCKITKDRIPELGMKRDNDRRAREARVDDSRLHDKILLARSRIYQGGHGVKSTAVEDLLAGESLVPTVVSISDLKSTCY